MQIIKCIASKPGLFDTISLKFSEGVTIIYGKNGSGKSLLARAMVEGIWKKYNSTSTISDKTWDTIYIDIIFSLNNRGFYKIINNSNKFYKINYVNNGSEKTIFIDNLTGYNPQRSICDALCAEFEGKVLNDFLERIDYDTFINSSFLPSPSDIERKTFINYDSLKKIILNDNSNFYRQFINLQNYFNRDDAYRNGPPEVSKFEEKSKDLNKEIQIIDIRDSRQEKLIKEKKTIKKEIDNLNSSLTSLQSQKEILYKIIDNLNKVNILKGEFENIKDEIKSEQQKITYIANMKNEIEKLFPQFKGIEIDDGTNLDKLQDIFNNIRNLNEKIDNYFFNKVLKKRKFRKILIAINVAAVTSALFILARDSFSFIENIYLHLGIIGCTIILNIFFILHFILTQGKKELENLKQESETLKHKIKTLLEKSKVELEDYKLTEIYEFLLQYFEDYIDYTERKKDIAKMTSSLKAKEYLINMEKKLDLLKKEEELIKNEINTSIDTLNIVDDIENETSKIDELIHNIDIEIAFIKEKIDTKEGILNQVEKESIEHSSNSERMSMLLNEKDAVDDILKKWEINQKSMKYIADTLNEAIERNEEKQLAKLIDATLDKFNHLTGNQYITQINEDVIREIICSNSISDDLSSPIMHALLLSLKFSLSDFSENEYMALPLIIDDPFQFMDDERSNRFRDIVLYLSAKRQIIIFTHHSDKKDWGNYIEL